jgi:cytochrome c oxidase assembly protein Cox11
VRFFQVSRLLVALMSSLACVLLLAALAQVYSYKSFCLEIACDATTYGTLNDVYVYDLVAITNLDKIPHEIVCGKRVFVSAVATFD